MQFLFAGRICRPDHPDKALIGYAGEGEYLGGTNRGLASPDATRNNLLFSITMEGRLKLRRQLEASLGQKFFTGLLDI